MNTERPLDVTPWLLVRCETCDEEYNCHPAEEMRWSRATPDAAPAPICEDCWDAREGDHENDWFSLDPVTLSCAS